MLQGISVKGTELSQPPTFASEEHPGPSAQQSVVPLVADHELLRVIGRGAYGEVWLARHVHLGTLRAVKLVRSGQLGDNRQFQREFEGVRRYEPISRGHPNLVSILHVGSAEDCFYYVMELADGAEDGGQETENREPVLFQPGHALLGWERVLAPVLIPRLPGLGPRRRHFPGDIATGLCSPVRSHPLEQPVLQSDRAAHGRRALGGLLDELLQLRRNAGFGSL